MLTLPPLPLQRHTAQLREELLKLPCPEGLEPDGAHFSPDQQQTTDGGLLLKELPLATPTALDAETPGGSQDLHAPTEVQL